MSLGEFGRVGWLARRADDNLYLTETYRQGTKKGAFCSGLDLRTKGIGEERRKSMRFRGNGRDAGSRKRDVLRDT